MNAYGWAYYIVTRLVFFTAITVGVVKDVYDGTWHTRPDGNTPLVVICMAVPVLGEGIGALALWLTVNERLVEVSRERAAEKEGQ